MSESQIHTVEIEDRLQHFQNLMPQRVRRILLVASPYDSFLLEEEGRLDELVFHEFLDLNLSHVPVMARVATGVEALAELRRSPYDLVVSTLHTGDMPGDHLAAELKQIRPEVPVVLLAFDDQELAQVVTHYDLTHIEQVFVWHGDPRILLAIVKSIEDAWNVEGDVRLAGVGVILLVEDSVRYYSSFLPHLYFELMKQAQQVIVEGVNPTHKLMRMRARPKILLCTSYEEAEQAYRRYRKVMMGIISDVQFPRGGEIDPQAGLDFARMVRADSQDLPIMLQTRDASFVEMGSDVQARVVLKDSPFLLRELRRFMLDYFGFGEFVFRLPDGSEVGRVGTLEEMEEMLHTVPDEVLLSHAGRNHFSIWFRARTEFNLAEKLRRKRVSDFGTAAEMRRYLVETLREFRRERQSGVVAGFSREQFDPEVGFAKIGSGSLGGKARGLAFMREQIYNYRLRNRVPSARIVVPAGVVLASDIFDEFLGENDLRDFAVREESDTAIERAFLQARFPRRVLSELYRFLEIARYPLAVRSSSLLEDSQHRPFAGIYRTIMVPNNHANPRIRRRELVRAIKRVYASTFSSRAKDYLRGTSLRLEEERMAVILQRMGGAVHGTRFYPEVAGTARSRNFYPMPPLAAEDGVATVALGLGKTVVEGGKAVRFCPRYPERSMEPAQGAEALENAQTEFYALQLDPDETGIPKTDDVHVGRYGLATAGEDGTLAAVASVFSPENDVVYEGLARAGIPFVSMAPVLRHDVFPLARILSLLLELGERGMNAPVEIEFAVNLSTPSGRPREFFLLQMRPTVTQDRSEKLEVDGIDPEQVLCQSDRILGNGRIEDILDLVVVDRERFDPAQSRKVAGEVSHVNARLVGEGRPYALIGSGRWGSSEPWLGIPVTWDQIAGASVIVEADMQGRRITPSQGSHFFHNLTAAQVAYFTVDSTTQGSVDWAWLRGQEAEERGDFVRHVRLVSPVKVLMDGHAGRGWILKP